MLLALVFIYCVAVTEEAIFHVAETDEGKKGSRIIGRVLPAAVKLWLRSQVESVKQLDISLRGRDRQIISGYIPGVAVSAEQAVYEGIHIDQLHLSADDIRINIGQVLRGKPLRLLKAFPVIGEVALSEESLNASLCSGLLQEGLADFWRQLVRLPSVAQAVSSRYGDLPLHSEVELENPQVRLSDRTLALSFYPKTPSRKAEQPVLLATELIVVSHHILRLESPRWLKSLEDVSAASSTPVEALSGFQWDLGRETQLSDLTLSNKQLHCSGQVMVNP